MKRRKSTRALLDKAFDVGGCRLWNLITNLDWLLERHGLDFPIPTRFALRQRHLGKLRFQQMELLGLISDKLSKSRIEAFNKILYL